MKIVSYSCASCGGGATKITDDKFDCNYCGNTNKIVDEKTVISNNKFKVDEKISNIKPPKGMSTAMKVALIIACGLAIIVVAKHLKGKRKRKLI